MFYRVHTCVTTLLCLVTSYAFAQPSISLDTPVTFREGETLTILGENFGSKGNGDRIRPLLWDDFEDGVSGNPLPVDGDATQTDNWTVAIGNITYSNELNLPGSLLCSRHDMSGATTETRRANLYWRSDKDLQTLFISFWAYFTFGIDSPKHQIKLWRVENRDDWGLGLKSFSWGLVDSSYYYQFQRGEGAPMSSYYYSSRGMQNNAWFKVEFQAKQSSVANSSDGSIEVWHSRPSGPIEKILDLHDIVTSARDYGWNQLEIGQYATNIPQGIPSEAITRFDHVYVDNTWARVEIGDQPSWDACRHREMQIPQDWAVGGDSITITVNTGSFPYGQGWLYVVDENGVVSDSDLGQSGSQGYQITIERSPSWLAGVINRWHANDITADDRDRAVSWYMYGTNPPAGWEPTPIDIGNALAIVGQE